MAETVISDSLNRKTNVGSDKTNTEEDKFKKENAQQVVQSGERNVLNSYRSITYNFTLAGLNKDYLKDPNKLREGALELIILKSGGKGVLGIAGAGVDLNEVRKAGQETYDKFDAQAKRAAQSNVDTTNRNLEMTAGFNKESPGRFDMFIENVEIESLMAFNDDSNVSLPSKIKFDVVEPYSVNGFIEALHVAAVSAGYPNYQQASFVLKMEFWGYSDTDIADFKDPEIIENSTRYYVIGFTGMEVDITERGTRYQCSAVPYDERAFGEPNLLKKSIKMHGTTVSEILSNLITAVNKQVSKSDADGKESTSNSQHNTYAIKFKKWSDTDGWQDDTAGKIGNSKLAEILKDNTLYKMADPGDNEKPNAYKADKATQPTPKQQAKAPETVKYSPGKSVVQFAENTNIHDIISSVIRDSEYSRNILKNVKGSIDQYGMIEYFMVKIEVTNRDVIDEVSKKPFQEITYVVTPYKVHYKKLPNYGSDLVKEEDLKKLSAREYNFIYTGQNLDVINFKLNFNNLFFEAVPISMGNKDTPAQKTGAAPTNSSAVKTTGTDVDTQQQNEVPLNPVKTDPTYTQVNSSGPNAGQPLDDPYSVLAKSMHNSIINSQTSMVSGELEILGDPFYLVTGGMGNFSPKPDGRGKYKDGSANHHYGQLLVTINFRNPIDINSFEDGGMMFFDAKRVPFSGVYQITKVNSTFKDGMFKQRLNVLRMPGQILDQNLKPSDPADRLKLSPSAEDQVVPNTSRELSPSQRLDTQSGFNQLNRGTPNPGLPGELSNFTGATGGLGGTSFPLMNQTYGLVSRSGALMAGSSVIGQPLPSDVASNIRLNTSGLGNIAQSSLATSAMVAVAANVLTGNLPLKRAAGVLAVAVAGSAIASALKKPNIGSGIGEGATVFIPPFAALPTSPTANDIKFGANIDASTLPVGSLNNITGVVSQMGSSAMEAVTSIGKGAGELVNGVKDKISALTATPADPQGIGAKVGLDVSKLSGLDPRLQSNVLGQVNTLVQSIPQNVNLNQALDSGVAVGSFTANQIKNIPPSAPYSAAPKPEVDTAFINQVVAKGGIPALENLYGVNNINKLSTNMIPPDVVNSALLSASAGLRNPLSNIPGSFNLTDATVLKNKIFSAQTQLNGITGQRNVADNNIAGSVGTRLGSISSGQSPLDKLVTNIGKTNLPPYGINNPTIGSNNAE